jgi:precorrin-6A/cobalt-precorrin-6A reductase
MITRVLILGGTGEARELASRAVSELSDRLEVITSLTSQPPSDHPYSGLLRIGSFVSIDDLAATLISESIDLVVDATHPFAETISMQAYAACLRSKKLLLLLNRPPWFLPSHAKWTQAQDLKTAAEVLPRFARRAFITTGRRDIQIFNEVPNIWYLIRLHRKPEETLPLANHYLITGSGPFFKETEAALIKEHMIDTLVAKESGGHAGQAKIDAAVAAGIHILLIGRPDPEPGASVETVPDALEWLNQQA